MKRQITTNGAGSKAKCIQVNGSLQHNGDIQANGGLYANGGLQADGDLQVNGDLQTNGGVKAHSTCTARTKAKLASISERDFDFDHVYEYIDGNSDDDDYI